MTVVCQEDELPINLVSPHFPHLAAARAVTWILPMQVGGVEPVKLIRPGINFSHALIDLRGMWKPWRVTKVFNPCS